MVKTFIEVYKEKKRLYDEDIKKSSKGLEPKSKPSKKA